MELFEGTIVMCINPGQLGLESTRYWLTLLLLSLYTLSDILGRSGIFLQDKPIRIEPMYM